MQNDICKVKRINVVIGSVLKPITEPRMFEKFGLSLAKTNKYAVFLVGYKGDYLSIYDNIRFKSLFDFSRLSIFRFFAPIKFLIYLYKVKPKVIILQSYELLFVGCIYKYFGGAKLLYDVQENYYRNIIYSQSYNYFSKYFLASYVRGVEKLSANCIDHFILAEKCYASELNFIPKYKTTIVENKYFAIKIAEQNMANKPELPAIRCLFSGTISKETGIFEAIDLVAKLHKINKNIYLVLAGHFSNNNDYKKLKKIAKKRRYIKLIGNSYPMSHQEIINQIAKSSFGIISYPINEITKDRIPTKLYEYLANKLPILCTKNELWIEIIKKHEGGIAVDFKNPQPESILEAMETQQFYTVNEPNTPLLWINEEEKLLTCVAQHVIEK